MSDKIKLSLDRGTHWAVIVLGDDPVAVASFDGAYRVQHMACYVEREPRLSPDVFDALGVYDSEIELLEAFKAAIEQSENWDEDEQIEIAS